MRNILKIQYKTNSLGRIILDISEHPVLGATSAVTGSFINAAQKEVAPLINGRESIRQHSNFLQRVSI